MVDIDHRIFLDWLQAAVFITPLIGGLIGADLFDQLKHCSGVSQKEQPAAKLRATKEDKCIKQNCILHFNQKCFVLLKCDNNVYYQKRTSY